MTLRSTWRWEPPAVVVSSTRPDALGVVAVDHHVGGPRQGVLGQQQTAERAGRHGALLVEGQHRGPVRRAGRPLLEVAVADARRGQHRDPRLGAVLPGQPRTAGVDPFTFGRSPNSHTLPARSWA